MLWNVKGLDRSVEDLLGGLLTYFVSTMLYMQGMLRGENTRLPQLSPSSDPGVNAICKLSLLLFLSFAPIGFSPGTLVLPSLQKLAFSNSNSARNDRRRIIM